MTLILYGLVIVASIWASRGLAARKGQDQSLWTIGALVAGPIAVLVLWLLPAGHQEGHQEG